MQKYCLEKGITNSKFSYLIQSTNQLVHNCSKDDYFIFNNYCLLECPKFSTLNNENICECSYLYSVLGNKTTCYPESELYCGNNEVDGFPFTIEEKNGKKYCMKYCPLEYEFMFIKHCYEKCPVYLKINEEKKNM